MMRSQMGEAQGNTMMRGMAQSDQPTPIVSS